MDDPRHAQEQERGRSITRLLAAFALENAWVMTPWAGAPG